MLYPEFRHYHQHLKIKKTEFIPVHMLTAEFPAGAKSIADFRKATAEDMVSSLLMKTVMDGWPDSRKDCHPLLLDYWNYRDEVSAEIDFCSKAADSLFKPTYITKYLRLCTKDILE